MQSGCLHDYRTTQWRSELSLWEFFMHFNSSEQLEGTVALRTKTSLPRNHPTVSQNDWAVSCLNHSVFRNHESTHWSNQEPSWYTGSPFRDHKPLDFSSLSYKIVPTWNCLRGLWLIPSHVFLTLLFFSKRFFAYPPVRLSQNSPKQSSRTNDTAVREHSCDSCYSDLCMQMCAVKDSGFL